MSKRQGPVLEIYASCVGCEWVRSEDYAAQGDSGSIVSCMHAGKRERIGDTTWRTPEWCPFLAKAKRRLAVTLANDAQVP